jgi:hypothetical protein
LNLFVDFSLAQKHVQILLELRLLFDIVKDSNIGFDKSWQGYRFYLSNKQKLNVLVLYLQNYGLQTKKRYAFTIWNQIHRKGLQKEHLSHIGMVEINQLICDLKLANGGGSKGTKVLDFTIIDEKEKLKI